MSKVLYIDTSDNKQVSVALEINGKKDMIVHATDKWKAQVVLPLIQQLLHKHELTFGDITAITVNSGPGSFTGLRVGVSIANALGTWLHIPVNSNPVGTIVEPQYA